MVKPLKLVGLLRFESMLALILIAVPIALRSADDRGSISAYHDMADPRWFFVPLTAASMMLITNGLVRSERHGHNAALGLLLFGVIMLDHDGGSATVHFACAVAFFVLGLAFTTLMITHYMSVLSNKSKPSVLFALIIGLAVAGILGIVYLLFDPPTFWLESVGVWIIALHFLAHSVWEVRRPNDHAEPPTVLQQLSPKLYRVFGLLLSPLTKVWRRINNERLAAANDLARKP